MYIYVHAAFLLNFILKNISPKKLIKDGNWYKLILHISNFEFLVKIYSKNNETVANPTSQKIQLKKI